MTAVQRLVANGNSIINFLKEFSSATPKDVSVDWVDDDGTVETKTFANIKKFQDSVNLTNDDGVIKDLDGNIIRGKALPQVSLASVLTNGYENDWVDYNDDWTAKISKTAEGVVTVVGLITNGSQNTTIGHLPDEYKPLQNKAMFINQASNGKFERIDYHSDGLIYCNDSGTRDDNTGWVSINATYQARVEV